KNSTSTSPRLCLDIRLQQRQKPRPTLVLRQVLARKPRVRQAHCRGPVLLLQIETNKCLWLLPVGKPGEFEQPRTVDGGVLATNGERLAAHAHPAHRPCPANTQVRLQVGYFELSLDSPPLGALARIGQRLEHPLRCSLDGDLFHDLVASAS